MTGDGAPTTELLGVLDTIDEGGRAAGWARRADLGGVVEIDVSIDGERVDTIAADRHREDLRDLGWGNCAYWYDVPNRYRDGEQHEIALRFAATGALLEHSPQTFTLGKGPDKPASTPVATGLRLEGHFDGIETGGWAAGWARFPDSAEKVIVEAWIDGQKVGETLADQFRDDLRTMGDCAFWFGIPEDLLDGQEHAIELRAGQTGEPLPKSPRKFVIGRTAETITSASDNDNLIRSATFANWPKGLSVNPSDQLTEVVPGWLYQYKNNTNPQIRFEADKPRDVGLPAQAYAMRITVTEGGDAGYMRLVVPLAKPPADLSRYRFSVGVRRPPDATDAALHVSEIYLATLADNDIKRVTTLSRALRHRGTRRILNVSLAKSHGSLAGLPAEAKVALVFELRGNGDLTLFSPSLLEGSIATALDDDQRTGAFEDPVIRDQIDELSLSPIWRRTRAVGAASVGAAPVAVRATAVERPSLAVPFIQIVVPIYNAAADVEDLLRSLVRCTDSPMEVLILDDGSEDFARGRIGAWEAIDPRIRYFRHVKNVGYTRNINVGLQATVSEFAVLINSDTVVTPGWLGKMYAVMATDERVAAVGPLSNAASWQSIPRTKGPAGEWVVNSFGETITPDRIAAQLEALDEGVFPDFPLLNGFCTLFRKAALEEVGYFDDNAFPRGYGEENDLCLRLVKAGWRLRVATDTYVHHSKSKSFGAAQRLELSKAANKVLRGKHPEVDFPTIEARMQTDPTINRIRQSLSTSLGIEPIPADA